MAGKHKSKMSLLSKVGHKIAKGSGKKKGK